MKAVLLALTSLLLSALAGGAGAADTCLADTSQADFQTGTNPTNVDTTTSSGNVILAATSGGAGGVDQQNTVFSTTWVEQCGTAWCGQTFTPGKSGALTRIDVNMICHSCSPIPQVVVSVRATSGGLPTGLDLASTTFLASSTAQFWYTANFNAPATVTAGTTYAIVIRTATALTAGFLALSNSQESQFVGNDVYAGGALIFSSNGASWTIETGPKPSVDAAFKTYIGGGSSGYVSAGDLVSSAKDSNPGTASTNWTTLKWNNSAPAGTTVRFQAAASNNSVGPFTFVGPDGTAGTFFTTATGSLLSQFNGNRYLKYRSYLTTNSSSATPTLNDVTWCYSTTTSASADLSISNSDGATTETPGSPVTYTIIASNPFGSSPVTGATVTDAFPATLNSCTWTCSGANGGTCPASGSGNINSLVNLPAGASVTYSATCTIASTATGSLSNTASVAVPADVTDPTPGNNSAMDTDTLAAQADLRITNSDGVTSAPPGGSVTYTIAASNAGPSSVTGAIVQDNFSTGMTCNWTCTGTGGGTCPASGSGNLNHSVNLPSGANVTFSATCAILTTVTPGGTLSNTATVSAPAGVTDPTLGNNSATATFTLAANADLAITNDDGVTSAPPGGTVTYTIKASNLGPDFVGGAIVRDSFSTGMTCNWTCTGTGGGTCAASGSGNLNHSVNLPSGASVTFTATCAISAAASGTLTNTASITAPAGVTDPSLANNSATDTDSLGVGADPPALSLTDSVEYVRVGDVVSYVIHVSNPGATIQPTITDALPAQLSGQSWQCSPSGGATCGSSSGSGDTLSDKPTVPSGGAVDYTYTVSVLAANSNGEVSNTASMKITGGNGSTMSASDADTVVVFLSGFEGGTTPMAMTPAGSGTGVTAQFGVDGGLLTKLGPAPVTVASAQSASGQTLFSLQLMRSGNNVLLRSVTPIDGGVFSDVAPWQVVDLRALRLGFEWQSATTRGDDGFLRAGSASQQTLIAANNSREAPTQLQVAVVNGIPWLVLAGP